LTGCQEISIFWDFFSLLHALIVSVASTELKVKNVLSSYS